MKLKRNRILVGRVPRLLALSVLAVFAVAAAPATAEDLAGWRETRWGMSRAELKRLFPDAAPPAPVDLRGVELPGPAPTPTPGHGSLVLARVDIAGSAYLATGSFDDARGLYAVSLVPAKDRLGYSEARALASSLEAALSEKYGPPHVRQDSTLPKRIWRFPSTRIQLMFLGVAEVDHGGLVLTYSRHDPAAETNL